LGDLTRLGQRGGHLDWSLGLVAVGSAMDINTTIITLEHGCLAGMVEAGAVAESEGMYGPEEFGGLVGQVAHLSSPSLLDRTALSMGINVAQEMR
jgi:hypothetical protein